METSIPDIPRSTGPTRALVHDRLEGFSQLVIRPRRVEPLLQKPQGTVGPHMTTGLMRPLEERRDSVARHDYPVLMAEVGLVPFPLFLVLSPRKLHPILHIKGGICVQKNDTQFPRVST